MFKLYIIGAAISAIIGGAGVWYILDLRNENTKLKGQVTSLNERINFLTEELSLKDMQIKQRDDAAAVAAAALKKEQERTRELDSIREWIIRNDDGAPIPPMLLDALNRILRRNPSGSQNPNEAGNPRLP